MVETLYSAPRKLASVHTRGGQCGGAAGAEGAPAGLRTALARYGVEGGGDGSSEG